MKRICLSNSLLGILFALVGGCKVGHQPPQKSSDAVAAVPERAEQGTDRPKNESAGLLSQAEAAAQLPTLREAVDFAKPQMTDTQDKHNLGSTLLSVWALNHMTWSDVAVSRNETTFARVQKDSEDERGKRMCVNGLIIQISTERTLWGKLYSGLIIDYGRHLYSFHAVGSTGNLVSNSRAHFCGVVTANYNYANSGGGTGHAIDAVGMFDLPKNRRTLAAAAVVARHE